MPWNFPRWGQAAEAQDAEVQVVLAVVSGLAEGQEIEALVPVVLASVDPVSADQEPAAVSDLKRAVLRRRAIARNVRKGRVLDEWGQDRRGKALGPVPTDLGKVAGADPLVSGRLLGLS